VINEGIDLALRVRSKLDDDPNLVLRQFEAIEQRLFASQAYLNEFGNLTTPEQLPEHRIISMAEDHLDQQFLLTGPDQQQKKIKVNPVIMGSNLLMLAELATQNCGIALLPDSIAQDFIKTGQLVTVLPEWTAPHGIFHAVYPSRRGLLPAVRVFIDYLVEQLTQCSTKKRPG